jgi:hypothetical protein
MRPAPRPACRPAASALSCSSRRCPTAAARHDDLGRRQFRPVQLGDLAARRTRLARIGRRLRSSRPMRCRLLPPPGSKPVVRTVMTLIASSSTARSRWRCRRRSGARRCRRIYLRDVADLRDIELRRDARRDVLAVRGGRSQDMAVVLRDLASTCAATFSARPSASCRGIGEQHLGYARDRRGCGRPRLARSNPRSARGRRRRS